MKMYRTGGLGPDINTGKPTKKIPEEKVLENEVISDRLDEAFNLYETAAANLESVNKNTFVITKLGAMTFFHYNKEYVAVPKPKNNTAPNESRTYVAPLETTGITIFDAENFD